ncbi:hypothetical protein [Kaistia sp. MMO-174]|uniref:hypothetical protein n=1 Tax=Kaistia sp. MMO-174 TaxID=3081256 RepID=UPI003017DFF2
MSTFRKHRFVVTLAFDKPVTRAEALVHGREYLYGEFPLAGSQAGRMTVRKIERPRPPRPGRPRSKATKMQEG